MEKRNIYKLDDFLIVLSFLILIPAVVLAWPWLKTLPEAQDYGSFFRSAPDVIGYRTPLVLFYLSGSVAAQLLGRLVRRREKQALKVLDYMLYARDTTTGQIAQNLGYPESRVSSYCSRLSYIRDLNLHKEGNRVWIALPDLSTSSAPPATEQPASPQRDWNSTPEGVEVESSSYSYSVTRNEKGEIIDEKESHSGSGKTGDLKDLAMQMRKLMENPDLSSQERKEILTKTLKDRNINLVSGSSNSSSTTKTSSTTSTNTQGISGKKIPTVLIIILIFTPLWPLAIFLVFKSISQRKAEAEAQAAGKKE